MEVYFHLFKLHDLQTHPRKYLPFFRGMSQRANAKKELVASWLWINNSLQTKVM